LKKVLEISPKEVFAFAGTMGYLAVFCKMNMEK